MVVDLLDTDLLLQLTRRPAALREQILAAPAEQRRRPIIIDEVQKVPALLDEVHGMIESQDLSFILCGSSARKLRRGRANLLGGRAWRFAMHPLTTEELSATASTADWHLLDVLNRGLVPSHYLSPSPKRSLGAYVTDYLKEEIFDEGLTRNLPAFSRFFEAMSYSHGEQTNYANIARDAGVDGKTVKEYYQILVDTLLAERVDPFKRRQSRKVITKTPRYYLFDVGVAGALTGRWLRAEKGEAFGRALEHFVLMELLAFRSYEEADFVVNYWRTRTGLEVDFVLAGGDVAIEVKGTDRVDGRQLRSLAAFHAEFGPRRAIVVCNEPRPRRVGPLELLPVRMFLRELWDGAVV